MADEEIPTADIEVIGAFEGHLALERRLSPHTVAAYVHDVGSLATFLQRGGGTGEGQLLSATYPSLRRWLAQLRTLGYAKSSLTRKAASIRAFYAWALRRGLIAANPTSLLTRPTPESRLPSVLKTSEAAAVAEAPGEIEPLALRDRAILELLYGCGLRVAELCALDVADVQLDPGRLHVMGKGS